MMTKSLTCLFLLGFAGLASAITGIPEPGAIFYGRVTAAGSTVALNVTALRWTVVEAGTGRTVELSVGNGIELTAKDGEVWFLARVPFQTTAVAGVSLDPLPAGTFALSSSPVSYNRSVASVNGQPAVLKAPAGAAITLPGVGSIPPARGLVERVDLELSASFRAMYEAWVTPFFPAADPRALPDADPDRDGINNLMERALGLDPSRSSAVPVSVGSVSTGGSNYLTYTYFQPAGTLDAPLVPEISENLQTWQGGPTKLVEVSSVADGTGRRVTVRDVVPMSPTRKAYIRLRATALRP